MGNLCSSERDPFSQPGRPLGTTPAARTSVSVPASATIGSSKKQPPRKVGGPPRTLGGSSVGSNGNGSGTTPSADAGARAAAAAEARSQQSKQRGGKLQAALQQQRGMTDAEALRQASEAERRQRDLDQSTKALNYS
ncbi:hypothetical protein C8A00DRAFT_28855 [Chaetomidium leptoderma]|uniref:Uncharacterized protein n=1 Tax=Chaetomidium leptoderma TaxID=669021 RepID=A0AAN6VUY1_9PEZI|nr:hypothetical protein C8A00DRAFT_28855 [Chaetomidium leptoderma]